MNNLEMDLLHLFEMMNEESPKLYLKKILEEHFKSIPEEPMLIDRSPSLESIIPSFSAPIKDSSVNNKLKKKGLVKKNEDKELKNIEMVINDSFTTFKIIKVNSNSLINNDAIIDAIQNIEKNIKVNHKNVLNKYIEIGKLIKTLKSNNPFNFLLILKDNNINYGLQYAYFLIRLYNLSEKHKKLYECSLSLYYVKKHFEIIKHIC